MFHLPQLSKFMPNFTLSNVTDNKEGPSGVVCLYIIYHLKTSITHETSFTDIILRHRSSSGKLVLSFQTQRQNLSLIHISEPTRPST